MTSAYGGKRFFIFTVLCSSLQVKIGNQYQSHVNKGGMSEESVEALLGLERISASCSPMTMSTFATLSANLGIFQILI